MELYPSNTFILGIFLEAQKGQGIWGRVRAILGESATDTGMREKSLARRVAEVWMAGWEKGRWEAEQERTRGGLSAAVQSERWVILTFTVMYTDRARNTGHGAVRLYGGST